MLYFVYLCLFVRLGLFKSYSCDLVFIIIFIFITVNHIVSLKHTHTIIFLGIFVKNSASGCCLAFAYFFAKFQPGFACKSVAYKKKTCISATFHYKICHDRLFIPRHFSWFTNELKDLKLLLLN